MNNNELPKDFDCLEMKRQIQAKVYEEIKDLNTEEMVEYYKIQSCKYNTQIAQNQYAY